MDLSKAFDCLNHELLIAKLSAYGFSPNALRLIHSYLSERKQMIKDKWVIQYLERNNGRCTTRFSLGAPLV